MTQLSRRHALAAGLGFCAVTLSGTDASAQPLIRLPDDIVQSDAATITAVRTPSPVVAMTFDDGPHPTHTPRLLDMLRERGLKATFYLIGNRVVQYPQIARRIADEGHEIGNHSWSHPFLDRLGTAAVTREIDQTTNAIFCRQFCGLLIHKIGADPGQPLSRVVSLTMHNKVESSLAMISTAAQLTRCPKPLTA